MPNNMKYYVEISLRDTNEYVLQSNEYVLQSKWYDTYEEAVGFICTLDFVDYNLMVIDINKCLFNDAGMSDIEVALANIETTRGDIELFSKEIAENEYVYAGMPRERIIELLCDRLHVSDFRAWQYVRLFKEQLEKLGNEE